METRARLTTLVAAVSVTAVITGSALAYRQVPKPFGTQAAAPLTAPAGSSPRQISETPAGTPSAPTRTSGPVKVVVDLAKLGKGRAPQVPYVVGREVRGGTGWMRKIPGTDTIHQVARLDEHVLAVVSDLSNRRLIKLDDSGKPRYTAGVSSLVGSDGGSVAYAAVPDDLTGGAVYSETAGSVRKLDVPAAAHSLEVVRLMNDGTVYFRWKDAETAPWKLFEWVPGAAAAQRITTITSPDKVSPDGAVASSTSNSSPGEITRLCSTVTLVATGKQLWRTCDSVLSGFTPDHSVAIGVGDYAEVGTAARITAQDTATGKVIREWTGTFEIVVPEDDQHLLIVAVDKSGTKSSIIRCAITTGSCEIAVPAAALWMSLSGR